MKPSLDKVVAAVHPIAVDVRHDGYGVAAGWCTVPDGPALVRLAEEVRSAGGRLSMVTAHRPRGPAPFRLSYHFDLDGDTLTARVVLAPAASVPTLTPIFRNADWHERELMELFGVTVAGHPDPRRLFLDESIDAPARDGLVPFSLLASAASTRELWEKIMAAAGGAEP